MHQDHHGVTIETLPQRSPTILLAIPGIVMLGLFTVSGLTPALWNEETLLMLVGALLFAGIAALFVRHNMRRVVVRIDTEYLVCEESGPLRTRAITRIGLRSIKRWEEIAAEPPATTALRIWFGSPWTLDLPFANRGDIEPLIAQIENAIAAAPGAVLRRTERPPDAIVRMCQGDSAGS